jgi:hypothetical protein
VYVEHRHVLQIQIGRRGLRPRAGDGGARAIAQRGSVRGRRAWRGSPRAFCLYGTGETCASVLYGRGRKRGGGGERGGERGGGRGIQRAYSRASGRGKVGGGATVFLIAYDAVLRRRRRARAAHSRDTLDIGAGGASGGQQGVGACAGLLAGPFLRTKTLGGVRQACRASVRERHVAVSGRAAGVAPGCGRRWSARWSAPTRSRPPRSWRAPQRRAALRCAIRRGEAAARGAAEGTVGAGGGGGTRGRDPPLCAQSRPPALCAVATPRFVRSAAAPRGGESGTPRDSRGRGAPDPSEP